MAGRVDLGGGAELGLQAREGDFELHRPDGGEQRLLVAAVRIAQHLHHALLVERRQPAAELLVAARVAAAHHGEVLGREARHGREPDGVTGRDGVARPQARRVDQADHVAGEGLLQRQPLLPEGLVRVPQRHRAPAALVMDLHPALEPARADPDVGQPVAVARVGVGLHLEHEAGEGVLDAHHAAVGRLPRPRRAAELHHRVEQVAHARVAERGPEEDRRGDPAAEVLVVVVGADAAQQVELVAQPVAHDRRQALVGAPVVHGLLRGGDAVAHPAERLERAGAPVHQAEVGALVHHRPCRRRGPQPDLALDLVEQLEGVAPRPVELVDERDDGRSARAADLEELQGLRLQALGRVDHHDRGVGGREHPVGVLREVLVARGVEQVEDAVAVGELQRRRGDRDAAGALDLHPVGARPRPPAARAHRAGQVDRPGLQQQALGEGRLTGVRVGDDREGAPAGGLGCDGGVGAHPPDGSRCGGAGSGRAR